MSAKGRQASKRNFLDRLRPRFDFAYHPFVLPVVLFFALLILSSMAFVHLSGETIGAADSRVVRFSLDGETRSLPTRAATVGELLERLEVELTEHDIVEPALDTPIIENDFVVNVYKAKPVTVIDEENNRRVTLLSAHPTPRLIAENAGLKLFPEDRVEVELPEDNLKEGVLGPQVVVDRAETVYVNLYGNPITFRTHAKTVREVLEEKDIKPLPDDTIEPDLDVAIGRNARIFVIPVGKEIISREEEIPAPVETVNDPNLPMGTVEVREEGSPGRRLVTRIVDKGNPGDVSQTIQSVVAVEPVARVVVRGTKVVYGNPSDNVELGRQIAADLGYSDQFSCIYNIFQRESKWSHTAHNRSSGAYGIPQALPGSKMGPGWQHDAAVQIRWGINYMVNRYGSPCAAQRFWEVNHWY